MDDRLLAEMLRAVQGFEDEVRAYLAGLGPAELPERDNAQIVARQVTALRKPLQTWLSLRAMRAALIGR